MRPLAIDLYAGLGGWAEGFLAEGFDVVGFDIERHDYGTGGYPGQLVIQDVLTLHGSQFKDAMCIVASPPCQTYSYMAMPWKRAKQMAKDYRSNMELYDHLNELFNACFRIQREACEAAGRHIPLIIENVKGAQPWIGRARWHFGSFYLWGDIPALMPPIQARKNNGGSWYAVAPHNKERKQNPDGRSGTKNGNDWFGAGKDCSAQRRESSASIKRKAASAQIAKIPFPLARHIAKCFYPQSPARRENQGAANE